ncbi:MAG: response regulator [Planctomycetota bacterium]
MSSTKRIAVMIVEDHEIVRSGLRKLLECERDLEVVGEASNGRQSVTANKKLRPDVIVMDIAMPLMNGLEATRQIRATDPSAKILILSAHADEAYVDQVMAMGAMGYLIKQTSAQLLAQAIRAVHKGDTFFSQSIAVRNRNTVGGGKRKKNVLTSREAEVLQLVVEGQANKQVAVELAISVKTVEKHRHRLMEKLNIHDTAGLTRYAIAAGIIESSVHLTVV